jgi:hypothetical protein
LKVRLGNARCRDIATPALPPVFCGATHVVFDGRASSPLVGVDGILGGSAAGESSEE